QGVTSATDSLSTEKDSKGIRRRPAVTGARGEIRQATDAISGNQKRRCARRDNGAAVGKQLSGCARRRVADQHAVGDEKAAMTVLQGQGAATGDHPAFAQ